MPLNNKRLIQRARKAGKASGRARHKRAVIRNEGLVLAYKHLADYSMSTEDRIRALNFLLSIKAGANLPEGVPLLVHLAVAAKNT
ncbi:MAG TPA: hypothetical protein DEF07_00875 [Nitrosomonas sp.]|uniref:hypothetical protein n=1 Tax=Nitrosomonas sp. TaxID=42353 RepID=UPI000E882478|nr:hypothetical protein [Nitrosomonas sp.]GJL74548.1 MAG: hypothetical protein NMNS02_06540 [Nitrosomonas sp.]HBV20260.1 hypothetical protein [Nitrosomonas sp.]